MTEATCEGPHAFGLQVSKLQEPGVGWGGKGGEEMEGSGPPGGWETVPGAAPKGRCPGPEVSVSIRVSGHTRGIQPLEEAHVPSLGAHPKKQRCFFREMIITVEQTA